MKLTRGRGRAKELIAKQYLIRLGEDFGLGKGVTEFQFAKSIKRLFRADIAWPDQMLLLEIDGGSFVTGGHNRGAGFEGDCEKYSLASILGFTLIRVTYHMIDNGKAAELLLMASQKRKGE